ncbi:MAG: trypsin-like serine protease [Kofleriaceae bacterium]|nr:trypsin-like serine protease [Kofleriaceae bacterium]
MALGAAMLGVRPAALADQPTRAVIGGHNAPAGKFADIAAIVLDSGSQAATACAGVLVAPTVVLTAGHCNDTTLTSVIIGSHDLSIASAGQKIAVVQRIEYPNSQSTYDVTALVLASPATNAPRAIATGWARFEIVNGATATFVGYGALDQHGLQSVPQLQEAASRITDGDCSRSAGCAAAAKPAGELGAGGMGIDTCPGDSGGPLYVETSFGRFVAGITSRGYATNQFDCSEGGIYVRPDKIIDWIEAVTQTTVARGPTPTAAAIAVAGGSGGETTIVINDPTSDRHHFETLKAPSRATFSVRADGRVRVCAVGAEAGNDSLIINVVDDSYIGTGTRAVPVTITIDVAAGTNATDCSTVITDDTGCSCRSTGGPGASAVAALAVLLLLMRRPT